jgi:iron complex outermembrane recepter protein
MKYFLFLVVVMVIAYDVCGQKEIDTLQVLPEVEVKVGKLIGSVPYSISTLTVAPSMHQASSINEYLSSFAGIFTWSAINYAQDTRLSSRGFGARSAFGIRGVKIITDDLPDSSPDGQAQMDNIDFASLSKIELLRGPQSGMYGNNSGGVLNIYTVDLDKPSGMSAAYSHGSYGFRQLRLAANYNRNRLKASIGYNRTNVDGFREWSAFENNVYNGLLRYDIDKRQSIKTVLNFVNSPFANDPGGLKQEELAVSRVNARPANLLYNAGESVTQSKIGLIYNVKWDNGNKFVAKSYYVNRTFENKLPFEANGIVTIDRQLFGASLDFMTNFVFLKKHFKSQIGLEYDDQNDLRRQYNNVSNARGDLGFDQKELFKSKAVYAITNIKLHNKWYINANVRYDVISTIANDFYLSNGDQSGMKNIGNVNYAFSIDHLLSQYIRIGLIKSTGFESPTLNELSNNPNGLGGFNIDLRPMLSDNTELNVKINSNNRWSGQVSFFHIRSKNEIIGYELPNQNGRSYYRNAGDTKRNGIEVEGHFIFSQYVSSDFSYTFSDFKYGDYLDYDGNALPGLPKHVAYLSLRIKPTKPVDFIFENKYSNQLFLNDKNTDKTDGFVESNVRIKWNLRIKKVTLNFFGGVNNVFDQSYFSNIRINAAANRYFEAAPPLNGYFGLSVNL